MTMVATTYQTTHKCSEEIIIDILVAGFSKQLKGWWGNYLTNEEKSKYTALLRQISMEKSLQITIIKRSLMLLIPLFLQ